ncbi:MAG: nucleotidyltransferase family protein, partial [Pseudomonadota bacterium]
MIPVPQTAMVMAAGLGSRMRPLTDQTPKPLIDIAGKALLDRALDPLARAGVKRIVVNVHYLADQVEAHLAKRTDFDVTISDERGERLETGGALAKARPLLGDDPIFVVNTDAFWAPEDDSPLLQLAEYFDPADMDSVLLLADRERTL